MRKLLLLIISLTACLPLLRAQDQLEHTKGAYVDTLNRYYQQASLPLYLYVSHSADAEPTQLSDRDSKKEANPVEPVYLDGHGKHYFKHKDADHNIEQNFVVYADGIAPVSSISLQNAPHYINNGQHFYGKDLMVSLATKDEMSGIKELYHSVGGEGYTSYQQGAKSFDKEGDYKYRYYAVDQVGNTETTQTNIFTVDLTAPKTYYNVVGINKESVISTSTKIYLTSEDNISGVAKTYYSLDGGPEKVYTGGNVPFTQLPDGDHVLNFYSVDNVDNKESAGEFKFYLDKTAPIMSADVLGDKFVVGDQVYFSGRTKLKLTAVDNKAGIKSVYYAIDGTEFNEYKDPFYLPSIAGNHVIRFYALDEMENEGAGKDNYKYDTYRHNVSKVYVDLTGPMLGFDYTGNTFEKGDTVYVGNDTKIKLTATDPESGLQRISYNIDGAGGESEYESPFNITESGTHVVEYYGYDNVNNRNVDKFTLIVDNTAPEIFVQYSIKPDKDASIPIYPSYVTIFLSSTDDQTGYEKITYSINGGVPATYSKPIQGLKKGQEYTIKITAIDKLGNEKIEEIKFKTSEY